MADFDIKSLTSKKVAGIPVVFLILGIAVVALYGALKLKPSAPEAEVTDDADVAGDDAPDTSQPVFLATPTIVQPSGVNTGSVTATPMADTDELWKRRAIDYLRQNGYSLDIATTAITKYLAGEALTTTEAAARDKAVSVYGVPPETIPDTSTITPTTPTYNGPASKQGSPPTSHKVRGTSDDSFGELARLYYGFVGRGDVLLLKSYNPGKREPFVKGAVITIPKLVEPKHYKATSATRTLYAIARKNATTAARVTALNPAKSFPVAAGTRVRVR